MLGIATNYRTVTCQVPVAYPVSHTLHQGYFHLQMRKKKKPDMSLLSWNVYYTGEERTPINIITKKIISLQLCTMCE